MPGAMGTSPSRRVFPGSRHPFGITRCRDIGETAPDPVSGLEQLERGPDSIAEEDCRT